MSREQPDDTNECAERTWHTLAALCLGFLMIGMSATSVNLALSPLATELRLSETTLVWVVNAYLLTFGGFLLVSGRLGDFFGHSRMFLLGVAVFAMAALGCAFAFSAGSLIAARAIQGIGGAIVSAAALSAIAEVFTDTKSRARALSIRATVGASGSSMGLLFGGAVTSVHGWRGMFLASGVLGLGICILAYFVLPRMKRTTSGQRVDIGGALTVTASLLLVVFLVLGDRTTWYSRGSFLLLLAIGLLMAFIMIERRVKTPLLPADLLKARNFTVTNISAALWSGAVLAGNVVAALYLQRAFQLGPLEVGLMFLPATVAGALVALFVAPKLVMRFGFKRPLVLGFTVSAAGLLMLTLGSVKATEFRDLFPGMLLMGLGTGIAYCPLLLSALSGVPAAVSGAASGVINSSLTMGGAVGLAVLMSAAAIRTAGLVSTGSTPQSALYSGYRVAFVLAACFSLCAAVLCVVLARDGSSQPEGTVPIRNEYS